MAAAAEEQETGMSRRIEEEGNLGLLWRRGIWFNLICTVGH
jgi:muconolactone delta-isomerase